MRMPGIESMTDQFIAFEGTHLSVANCVLRGIEAPSAVELRISSTRFDFANGVTKSVLGPLEVTNDPNDGRSGRLRYFPAGPVQFITEPTPQVRGPSREAVEIVVAGLVEGLRTTREGTAERAMMEGVVARVRALL